MEMKTIVFKQPTKKCKNPSSSRTKYHVPTIPTANSQNRPPRSSVTSDQLSMSVVGKELYGCHTAHLWSQSSPMGIKFLCRDWHRCTSCEREPIVVENFHLDRAQLQSKVVMWTPVLDKYFRSSASPQKFAKQTWLPYWSHLIWQFTMRPEQN